MHYDDPSPSQRVNRDMPLEAGDLLAGVVAASFAPFGGANRLTVDDRHIESRLLAQRLAQSPAKGFVDPPPNARLASENGIGQLSFGKVAGQVTPLIPRAVEIQDRIDHPTTIERRPVLAFYGNNPRINCHSSSVKPLA